MIRPGSSICGRGARARTGCGPGAGGLGCGCWYAGAVSGAFAAIAEQWHADELRRGVRWSAAACACLPALDVIDAYSIVDGLLIGLRSGGVAVPLRAWLLLGWVIAAGCAVAWALVAAATARGRMRLFTLCAAMHAAYALATGLRPALAIAAGCFWMAYAGLRAASRG